MNTVTSIIGISFGALLGLFSVSFAIFAQRKSGKRSGLLIFASYTIGFVLSIGLMLGVSAIGLKVNVSSFFVTFLVSNAFLIFREILS